MDRTNRFYKIFITSMIVAIAVMLLASGIIALSKSMKLNLSFAANPNILCQIEAKSLEEGSAYDVIFRNTSETLIKEGITLNGNVLNIGNLFLSENPQTLGSSFMLKITNLTHDYFLQIYLSSQNSSVGFDKDYLIIDYNENAELTLSGISMASQVELNFTLTTNLSINQPETSVAYSFNGDTEVEPCESYTATLLVNNGYAANVVITTKSGKTLVRDKDYTWNEENGQLVVNSVLEEISISTEWGAKLKTGLEITDILYEVFSASTVSSSANIQPEEVVAGLNEIDDSASVYVTPPPSYPKIDDLQTIILGYYDQYPDFRAATADRSLDVNTEAANTNGMIRLYRDGTTAYILSENKIFANEDSSYLFSNSENAESDMTMHAISAITFNNFDTSKVENMSLMFHEFGGEGLDLSSFNTSKVTDMHWMFCLCENLLSIDLSSFDTSKVTNMYWMFYDCINLKTIYVSDKWSTASVTSSDAMFTYCTSLVGAIAYDSSKVNVNYANYTTGYLTKKDETS